MYATAAFEFNQADNGFLMSGNAFIRAIFLLSIFPRIISLGRQWFVSSSKREAIKQQPDSEESVIPTDPQQFETSVEVQVEEEPLVPKLVDEKAAYAFDLFFLRWSLLVDGILTTGAAFATEGWHCYLGLSPVFLPIFKL